MKRVVALACAGAAACAASSALAQQKPEKPRMALPVGGSISQMNKVAYFVALERALHQHSKPEGERR